MEAASPFGPVTVLTPATGGRKDSPAALLRDMLAKLRASHKD